MEKIVTLRLLTEAISAIVAGNASVALANCECVLAQDPCCARAWHLKGKALSALSGAEAALACFDRVLQLTPGNTDCRLDRAIAEKALGQYNNALQDIDLILCQKPQTIAAQQEKALIRQLLAKEQKNRYLRLIKS